MASFMVYNVNEEFLKKSWIQVKARQPAVVFVERNAIISKIKINGTNSNIPILTSFCMYTVYNLKPILRSKVCKEAPMKEHRTNIVHLYLPQKKRPPAGA